MQFAEKTAVSNFTMATEAAKQAMSSVRNLPKPLQTWQQAKKALEEAIAQLKTIPDGTSPYARAQEHLQQYQKQLKNVDQGMAIENRAMQALAQAENSASQAMSHTPSSVYSFELQNLQASRPLWNQAITQAKKVPPASYANLAAQEQLAVYTHNAKQIADGIKEIQDCNARTASSSFLSSDFCDTSFLSLHDPEFVATARSDEN